MKLPRFSRNSGGEAAPGDASGAPQPAPVPKTDAYAAVPNDAGAFDQQSVDPAQPVQPLPFDGVPPPPPPTAAAPPVPQAPPAGGEGTVKKPRFPRFLKSRKHAAAPSESSNTSASDAHVPPPVDAALPPGLDAPPPLPEEGDSVPPPVDPRAAEREEVRRRRRLIEIGSGVSMGGPDSNSEDGESTDDDARRRNNEEEDVMGGEDEGKPLEDAVVASVSDPPHVPALPTATKSTAFNSAADAFRHASPHPSAPHFIDTSHIDGAPLPGPPPQHSLFPPFPSPSGNSMPSSTFQPPAPYQTSTTYFPPSSAPQGEAVPPRHFEQPQLPQPSQNNAAEMAELFASRAFGAPATHSSPFPAQPAPLAPPPPPPPMSASGDFLHSGEDALMKRSNSARRPAPVGWGSITGSTPSGPVYAHSLHTSQTFSSTNIDPAVADKIKRGRELAMLAVQQEEKGNLGAAESGYIKALSLLVPASKELDIGSDLTKHVRKTQKAKIQREAAAMLDRCEELRRFIKANGPAVPDELPRLPGLLPKPAKPAPPPRESKPKDKGSAEAKKGGRPLPSPPPPAADGGDDDLLSRIANRQKMLPDTTGETSRATAPSIETSFSDKQHEPTESSNSFKQSLGSSSQPSAPSEDPGLEKGQGLKDEYDFKSKSMAHPSPDGNVTSHPSLSSSFRNLSLSGAPSISNKSPGNVQDGSGTREGGSVANVCFLCRRNAHLRTKCNHTFCSNCGNQVVSVFGSCPVPGCNELISLDDFDHILR